MKAILNQNVMMIFSSLILISILSAKTITSANENYPTKIYIPREKYVLLKKHGKLERKNGGNNQLTKDEAFFTVPAQRELFPKNLHSQLLSGNDSDPESISDDYLLRSLQSPICNDSPWKTFNMYGWQKDIKPCAWLNTLWFNQRKNYCRPSMSNAAEVCPDACLGKCPCNDYKSSTFRAGKYTRNCKWISWLKKFRNRKRYCSRFKNARNTCPDTCAGWCVYKALKDLTSAPTYVSTDSPSAEPTISPTFSPTRYPTEHPQDNFQDCIVVSVRLITDEYSEEISWYIRDQKTDSKIEEGNEYPPFRTYDYEFCLPINGCYEFVIEDTYGDGISQYGGSYTIHVNSVLIEDGGNFEFIHKTQLSYSSECKEFSNSTHPPTFSPINSLFPTNAPTICNLPVILNLTTDGYGDETSWFVWDKIAETKVKEGKGYFPENNYIIDFCLPPGRCYEFVIEDEYGDGIFCGNGGENSYHCDSYFLFVENILIAKGGNFTFSERTNISPGESCRDDLRVVKRYK